MTSCDVSLDVCRLLSATGGGGRSGGSTLGSHSLAPVAGYQHVMSSDIAKGQ